MLPFFQDILVWYHQNKRDLPWRNTQNPYAIWLSEVILQQTRVNQGLDYYHRFLENFPTIHHLARAHEDDVLKTWQGLGYYSRARNLHKTAQYIVHELKGSFPHRYRDLLTLPGIGPYTAAAIASFAFDEPQAAVDGNVLRWTSRVLGITSPVDKKNTLNHIQDLMNDSILHFPPHAFNQASMEFGALICTPKQPRCADCPIAVHCVALKTNQVNSIPVKSSKIKVKELHVYAIHVVHKGKILLNKRTQDGIWKNLFELPSFYAEGPIVQADLGDNWKALEGSLSPSDLKIAYTTTHLLSHRKLNITVFHFQGKVIPSQFQNIGTWHKLDSSEKLAFPKVFERYFHSEHSRM